jgi:two-component system response regulator DctR
MLAGGFRPAQPCCLLLDVRMPGMSGLALFEKILERGLAKVMPVIFLTGTRRADRGGHGQARGVRLRRKAFFRQRTGGPHRACAAHSAEVLARSAKRGAGRAGLAELTDRERDVMRLVARGLPNKLIADQLAISVRTVEVHRARVFDKMEVKSAVELANLLREV